MFQTQGVHLMVVVEGVFGYKPRREFAGGLAQAQCCAELAEIEMRGVHPLRDPVCQFAVINQQGL